MIPLRVQKTAEGAFVLRDLPSLMALALRQLPALLAADAPGIRDRVGGSPYDDEEGTRDWEKYAAPELAHLFRNARQVVEDDLSAMERERKTRRFRVTVPPGHADAWLAALAAGRVALCETHDLEADDLEAALPEEIESDRQRAILVIHLLGWVQGLLLEAGA